MNPIGLLLLFALLMCSCTTTRTVVVPPPDPNSPTSPTGPTAPTSSTAPNTTATQQPIEASPTAVKPTAVAPATPPPEPDEVPAHLGSARTSLAARPDWQDDTMTSWSMGDYAPSLPDADKLYEDLGETSRKMGDLQEALLVCRVETWDTTADTFSPPDMRITMRFGSMPKTTHNGPDDKWFIFFSRPLVNLKVGQSVDFDLWDRDVLSDDHICPGKGTYAGQVPFTIKGSLAKVDCRAETRDEVEKDLKDRLAAFDISIARIRSRMDSAEMPDPHQLPDWGLHHIGWDAAEEDLLGLAALVGWDDPRVERRITHREEAQHHWTERLHKAIADLEAHANTLDKSVSVGEHVAMSAAELQCNNTSSNTAPSKKTPAGKKKKANVGPCQLEVTLSADVPWSLEAGAFGERVDEGPELPQIALIDNQGKVFPLEAAEVLGSDGNGKNAKGTKSKSDVVHLKENEEVRLAWRTRETEAALPASNLLRIVVVGSGANANFFRLGEHEEHEETSPNTQ